MPLEIDITLDYAFPMPTDCLLQVMAARTRGQKVLRDRLDTELSERKQLHLKYLERVQELEKVRWEFKRHRYDDAHSDFPKGAAIGAMLNEFLRGIASSGQLWNTIENQHRRRKIDSNPTFGSGGFGHPTGGSWNFPNIGGGTWGGGGGGGRSGSIGGPGGFRTGGGF